MQPITPRNAEPEAPTPTQAAYHGHADAFVALLAWGADVHAKDDDGDSPLTLVQRGGDALMKLKLLQ
jgi:ankyrin repeat protein